MKKAFLCFLVLAFCFSLFSCENETANTNSTESGVTNCLPLSSDSLNGESTEDKVYVFDICSDSFSEDALKETIDAFQRYGTPFTVKQGNDISFSLDGRVTNARVQRVSRVDKNVIDAELNGGIYLFVHSSVDSLDKFSTITVDTDWWYDMASEDPYKNYPLWSYIVHAEYADGTSKWFYLRANFLSELGDTCFSGSVRYYIPTSDILSTFLLSDDDAKFLLDVLNNGSWKNGVCKCVPDRIINVGAKKLEYCSDCGAINLTKEDKSLAFTKGSRKAIWLESVLNINEE